MSVDVQRCPYDLDGACRCVLLRAHKGPHRCEHDAIRWPGDAEREPPRG